MAEPEKKRRISRVNSSQTSSNIGKILSGHRPCGAEVEGRMDGSILRITMRNFLTYDYTEVYPGPNLNMIVGANGTGKSSIVCAICLGLAGKTAVLGRGDKVGLYVKRGCQKGSIEIELYKHGGNLVITREIHVENNQSHWMINGKQRNQKAVEEEVKNLCIQVSNLCQFLPQEKVGEFAKMSKTELLEATEKSVGPPEMFEFHCELKNFRSKERELENTVTEKTKYIEKAKQRNERNKHDVNRYYEKKRHLDMIELLEKKKPWVEYESTRKELESVKREREEAKRNLSALRHSQAPMIRKIKEIEDRLQPFDDQIKSQTAAIKDAALKCKQKQDQLDRKQKEIEDINQAFKLKEMEEDDHQKRISNTRRIIEDLRTELAKVEDQPDVTPRINDVNSELRRNQIERARIDGEKCELCLQKKLNDMNNLMKVKEEKLRGRHRDTHAALQWLRQNRNRFRGNVYEPMLLEINVKDHRFAKYVENHISFQDLRAFVFQRKEDMEIFMSEVRDKMNLKVNSISAPEQSRSKAQPSQNIEDLRRFGFFTYLREMFDAPDEVMSYLCQQYNVHNVPVGTEQTKTMIRQVIEELNLRVLFTLDERYMLKRSVYSKMISTINSPVNPSQYLSIAVDAEEKRQLEQELNVRKSYFVTETAVLDRRDNELLAEKKKLSELKGKKRQLEQKISTKQDSLRQMEQNVTDLKKIEEETKEKVSAVNSQKVTIVKAFIASIKVNELWSIRFFTLARSVPLPFHISFVKLHLSFAFAKLPDTPDDIDSMLNEERSRSECFTGLSENVVDEYNRSDQEIKELENELEEKKNALESYRQNISEAKERWLNPLKQLVEQINEKFTAFFRSMNCAGEVDLHSEKEEDYDKYGIRIRVKFHSNTQLHELTPFHQSGGERSVSTMLYLMSLQELNRCPFRVVDEINQGMDPINERRVFDIVVGTACKERTSQYFFITPKLLQNLKYAEEMTVLCVHNGAYMLPPNQWDDKAFLRRRSVTFSTFPGDKHAVVC
uniref:Structural maintenance of chromosomes protein 5 n=1 Tax=Takifugu rubripes TaxID=31033 RepID=A0A674MAU8_TAKRU